jgi:hypothetical protein
MLVCFGGLLLGLLRLDYGCLLVLLSIFVYIDIYIYTYACGYITPLMLGNYIECILRQAKHSSQLSHAHILGSLESMIFLATANFRVDFCLPMSYNILCLCDRWMRLRSSVETSKRRNGWLAALPAARVRGLSVNGTVKSAKAARVLQSAGL